MLGVEAARETSSSPLCVSFLLLSLLFIRTLCRCCPRKGARPRGSRSWLLFRSTCSVDWLTAWPAPWATPRRCVTTPPYQWNEGVDHVSRDTKCVLLCSIKFLLFILCPLLLCVFSFIVVLCSVNPLCAGRFVSLHKELKTPPVTRCKPYLSRFPLFLATGQTCAEQRRQCVPTGCAWQPISSVVSLHLDERIRQRKVRAT